MKELAIKKLEKELTAVTGAKESIIKKPVHDALVNFCRQNEEFAQAVYQSAKTFGQCCAEILRGSQNGISDLEAYNRAVRFYFPGSSVRMELTIDLCAEVRSDPPEKKAKTLRLSLDDFLL